MAKSALIIGTLLLLTGSDVALAQSVRTQVDCSMLDVKATAMIEEHGRVADVSPERLYGAALVMQEARKACRNERFNEARALYESRPFARPCGWPRIGQLTHQIGMDIGPPYSLGPVFS